jgi:hypothetical protein
MQKILFLFTSFMLFILTIHAQNEEVFEEVKNAEMSIPSAPAFITKKELLTSMQRLVDLPKNYLH